MRYLTIRVIKFSIYIEILTIGNISSIFIYAKISILLIYMEKLIPFETKSNVYFLCYINYSFFYLYFLY